MRPPRVAAALLAVPAIGYLGLTIRPEHASLRVPSTEHRP